jgi:hypothetical protein
MKVDILPPFLIIAGAVVVIGTGLDLSHRLFNNGKVRVCGRAPGYDHGVSDGRMGRRGSCGARGWTSLTT